MQDSGDLHPNRPPNREMHAQELKYSPIYRESVQDEVRRGNFDEIRGSMWNKVWHLSHENAEHDRLILDIVRFRGRGPLKKPSKQNHKDIKIANTPAGVVWEDLPFLVIDMTDYWLNDCATMSASQRCNFARFLAKLASAGLCNDKLFQIALLVCRDALETARPLGSLDDAGDADPDRTMQDLTVADLLPAVFAWMQEARYKMISLSNESWNDCSDDIGRGGATFVESELGKKSPSGFSHWRWMFWLKRLEDINQEAKQAGEKLIAEQISLMLNIMTSELESGDPLTFRKFQAAEDLIPDRKEFSINFLTERVYLEWKESQEESDGPLQAAEALRFIHSRNVIHSDFGSHNFLIQEDGTLALADFGGSRIDNTSAVVSYSTRYARPCSDSDDLDSTEIDDLFALGTIIYEISVGHQLDIRNCLIGVIPQPFNDINSNLGGKILIDPGQEAILQGVDGYALTPRNATKDRADEGYVVADFPDTALSGFGTRAITFPADFQACH
ncbi:uncharacterized protein CDV56_106941 [Aspergillus thermomutatus]|uniref:Protein kinase domain-containing protein n=1 Tax=Aspergillus thermomutatus TaxID=41047 RepID=A0A397HWG1_ASPTH|nr:uncharacterized protein CDV56_106941 [Aspergillus thermomutatus]RHZ66348.1 hypothetical protein CDV56_106941 [Aspergillus thermomutatus]